MLSMKFATYCTGNINFAFSDREDDSDVQIVARDMIELAVLTLEGARGQLSHKQENVGQCFRAVRIFYRQDVLDENQLQSGIGFYLFIYLVFGSYVSQW